MGLLSSPLLFAKIRQAIQDVCAISGFGNGKSFAQKLLAPGSVREISTKLHIRRPSIRTWVKSGELHKKRNGRVAEDSLQSFLYRDGLLSVTRSGN